VFQHTSNGFFLISRVGHVWAVRKGPFMHVGLETSSGTIIAASPATRGVAEISKTDFAGDQLPKYRGYLGLLTGWEVEARAYDLIGTPYAFWRDNCEHLVTKAHGLKKHSPQLQAWIIFGVVCFLSFVAMFTIRKNRA
jgi:hypothetical protein